MKKAFITNITYGIYLENIGGDKKKD